MRKWIVAAMTLGLVFSTSADTTLVFGFDTTDLSPDVNGITYEGARQSITFSGAVSGSGQTTFDLLDGISGQVNFSIGAVGDLSSLSGTITPVGGAFNIGGNGGGVSGGVSAAYFDDGESWIFTFSEDVTLTAVRNWGEDPNGQTILTNGVAIAASPYTADFTGANIFVAAGDTLTFGSVDPGYFGFQDFTVNVVPEPATVAMLGIGGFLMLIVRRISSK